MARFGTATLPSGRALSGIIQNKSKSGFTRRYLLEADDGDAHIVTVFAREMADLPDDPEGVEVKFKDTDFVFAG